MDVCGLFSHRNGRCDRNFVDGGYGDSSRMYPVGEISRKAERLIEVTYESLEAGRAALGADRSGS